MQNDTNPSNEPVSAPESNAPTSPTTPEVSGVPTPPQPEPTESGAPLGPISPNLASSEAAAAPTSPESVPPAENAPAQTGATSAEPGRRKPWLVIALVLVLVAGAAAYYYYGPHHHKQPVATKQDIPLINYGMYGPGVGAAYPLAPNTGISDHVSAQLFEGLVAYQNQADIVPLLATGWTNPDDTHWIFTIRSGVTFHSGRALTPQDVKYSLDYAVAHQGDDDGSLTVSLASTIKSVAVNDNKVTITTNGPDPTLLNRLTSLFIFDSKATVGDADAGTGPYILKPGTKLSDTGTVIDLVAVPHYWGGHVYTKAVHIVSVSDGNKLASQAAAGKFDIAGQLSPEQLATARSQHAALTVSDLGINFVGINTLKTTSPLHTLAARQAAAYALNVPAIIKAGDIQGQAKQSSQLVPPAIPGYDASIQATPYNLTKAKQLLASVPNATAPLTLSYPQADETTVAEIIKELNAAGFNVKPQPEPNLGALVGVALGGKTDLYFLGYTSDTLDGLDILSTILVGNKDYDNPTIDSLAKQASTTLDPKTRIGLLQKISQQVATDVPDIPLFTRSTAFAVQKPYHLTSDIPNGYLGVYFWKVYQ